MFRQSFLVVLGFACGVFVASCRGPDPIALVPLPPGVAYPWRTQTGAPTPAEFAAIRRARLVVWNGALGADHYTHNWQPLPAFLAPSLQPESSIAATDTGSESGSGPGSERAGQVLTQPQFVTGGNDEPQVDDTRASPAARADAINLNSATSEELESLSGIGPSLASRIVEARPYREVDDLLRVRGIGPSTLARLAELVVAE